MHVKTVLSLICMLASQVCVGAPDEDADNRARLLNHHQISADTFDALTHSLDPDQKSQTLKHMVQFKTPPLGQDELSCLIGLIGHARQKSRGSVTSWVQKVYPTPPQNLTAYFAPVREILRQSNAGALIRLSEKITLLDPTASAHMALLITMSTIATEDPDHVMKYVLKVHPEPSTSEDAQAFIKQMTAIPHKDRGPLTTIARDMGLSKMEVTDKLSLLDLLAQVHPTQRTQVFSWINEIMPKDFKCVELCFSPVVSALQDPDAGTLISWAKLLFMSHKKREPKPRNAYDKLMYRNFLATLSDCTPEIRTDRIAQTRVNLKVGMTHIQVLKMLKDTEKSPS